MGVDAILLISSKWELDDVIKIIERSHNETVSIRSCDSIHPGMFQLNLQKLERMITVFTNHETPIGNATYLSLRSNEQGIAILRSIAEVLGGIFQSADCDETYEMIRGKFWHEDGLPYFLKYAIIHDGIEPNDIEGLLESIKQWYIKTPSYAKPDFIKQLIENHNNVKKDGE